MTGTDRPGPHEDDVDRDGRRTEPSATGAASLPARFDVWGRPPGTRDPEPAPADPPARGLLPTRGRPAPESTWNAFAPWTDPENPPAPNGDRTRSGRSAEQPGAEPSADRPWTDQAQPAHDQSGHDQAAHAQAGYDQAGYDQTGYDQAAPAQAGYDQAAHAQAGYDQAGYDQTGYDQAAYDQAGYDQAGSDQAAYDQSGYGQAGYAPADSQLGYAPADSQLWYAPVDGQAAYGAEGWTDQAGYAAEAGWTDEGAAPPSADPWAGQDASSPWSDQSWAAAAWSASTPPDSESPATGAEAGYTHGEHPYTDDGYAEAGYAEAGYAEAGYAEAGYAEAGYGQVGYDEQGYAEQSGEQQYGEPGYGAEPGYGEQGYGEQGYAAPASGEQGYAEGYDAAYGRAGAGYAEAGYEADAHEPGNGRPGYAVDPWAEANNSWSYLPQPEQVEPGEYAPSSPVSYAASEEELSPGAATGSPVPPLSPPPLLGAPPNLPPSAFARRSGLGPGLGPPFGSDPADDADPADRSGQWPLRPRPLSRSESILGVSRASERLTGLRAASAPPLSSSPTSTSPGSLRSGVPVSDGSANGSTATSSGFPRPGETTLPRRRGADSERPGDLPVRHKRTDTGERRPPSRRRTGLRVVAGAVIIVLLGFAGFVLTNGADRLLGSDHPNPTLTVPAEILASLQPPSTPFQGTPAERYAEGDAGITVPTASEVPGFTAAQVATGLQQVRLALIASRLDPGMMMQHDTSSLVKLLSSRAGAELQPYFDKKQFFAFATQVAPGYTLSTDKVRVTGSMTFQGANANGVRVLEIVTNYVWVYPFAGPLRTSGDHLVIVHDKVTWDIPVSTDVAEDYRGLRLSAWTGYASNMDCGLFKQSLLALGQPETVAAHQQDDTSAFDPNRSLDVPNTCQG
jgi:hypothetical protein